MSCLDDDAHGDELEVLWERELDAQPGGGASWSALGSKGFDPPRLFSAYLHTLRWNGVTATDMTHRERRLGQLIAEESSEPARIRAAMEAAKATRARIETLNDADADAEAVIHATRTGEKPAFPFHWGLAFPEVFARENPGFDAFVAKLPFAGGTRISQSTPPGYLGTTQQLALPRFVGSGTASHRVSTPSTLGPGRMSRTSSTPFRTSPAHTGTWIRHRWLAGRRLQ